MHPAMKTIKSALAYAKFESPDIKESAIKLIETCGTDLDVPNLDWEQSNQVDRAIKEVEDSISEYDGKREAIADVIANSEVSDSDDDGN